MNMNYKKVFLLLIICIIATILSIWAPLIALVLILMVPLVYGVILFPIVGLVILVFSGRFSRIPPFNNVDGPIYVGLLIILFLIVALIMRKNKELFIINKFYVALNSIFAIYLLIGVFINGGSEYGITKALEFSFYILPITFLVLIMITTKNKLWFFIRMLMLLSFLFAILGLFTGDLGSGRVAVLGGGSNVYGRFMVYGIISVIPFIHIQKKLSIKLLYVALFSLFILLAYFSGSRQAIIGSLISIFIYILLNFIKAGYTKKTKILLMSCSGIIIGVILSPIIIKKYLINTLAWNRMILLFEDDKGSSVSARTDMLKAAWEMFKEKPLFGWGTGSFADEYSYIMRYPHNLLFEILSENGIIGILILSLIIFISLNCAYKALKIADTTENKDLSLVITIITFFFVSIYFSQISGDMYDSRWIWLYGSLLAGLPFILQSKKKSSG